MSLAVVLALFTACTARSAGEDASADATKPHASAASAGRTGSGKRYMLPAWQEICDAARKTAVAVKTAEKDTDYATQQGCHLSAGGPTQIISVAILFERGEPELIKQSFLGKRDRDWDVGFAFSGPAQIRVNLSKSGQAVLGEDYDDGYYAFFPDIQVAGSRQSRTDVSILRGNTILSFTVDGSEWNGQRPTDVRALTPLSRVFGAAIVDQLTDAMLALLKPDGAAG